MRMITTGARRQAPRTKPSSRWIFSVSVIQRVRSVAPPNPASSCGEKLRIFLKQSRIISFRIPHEIRPPSHAISAPQTATSAVKTSILSPLCIM